MRIHLVVFCWVWFMLNQLEGMSMNLQLIVARSSARGLLSGTATADYGEVIVLRKLLLGEGELELARDLLTLAQTMKPTPTELSIYGPAA